MRILLLGVVLVVVSGCGLTMDEPCQNDADCQIGFVCSVDGECVVPPDAAGATMDGGTGDGSLGDDAGVPFDGGPTCSTVDADGDGFSECDGDCDDTNAWVYLGAMEVCGDGVDNGCTGNPPDGICADLGTFVAEFPIGNDMNPGTMTEPVATIGEGIRHATTIGGGVDVYVAEGHYTEDLLLIEGVSLFGGYEASGWTRDHTAYTSTIESITMAGLSFPSVLTRATEVDGFTIRGPVGVAGAAAVAVNIMDRASPVITNNVIIGPDTGGHSRAIQVNPIPVAGARGTPFIAHNEIHLGDSQDGWGGRGNPTGAVGVYVDDMAVELIDNQIFLTDDPNAIQNGISLDNTPPGTLLEGNVVRGTARGWRCAALNVFNANVVAKNNEFGTGRCTQGAVGVGLHGEGFTAEFFNNVIWAGTAPETTGVQYANEGRIPNPVPDIHFNSNFIRGGEAQNRSTGVHLGECEAMQVDVGEFYNNIIYSGTHSRSGGMSFGFFEANPNVDPIEFQANALHVEGPSASRGVAYQDEGFYQPPPACYNGPTGPALNTAAMINVAATVGSVPNLVDDCGVLNPAPGAGADVHIPAGSACIDAGTMHRAPPDDFEGDIRPAGAAHDIGVDEAG